MKRNKAKKRGVWKSANTNKPATGFLCSRVPGQKSEQPEAETKYGRVRGYQFRVDAAEKSVSVFLGLPFAKPPLGPLRFSEPQPPEPWKGVRDATSYPPM